MSRSIEAVVERDGRIRPLEDVRAPEGTHVIITFLPNGDEQNDTALLSKPSLAD